ncbi:unnamed protein product [Parajaminaea phylloscopi]
MLLRSSRKALLVAVGATIFLLLGFSQTASALGVVAFDYGADSLKTALIKPGMPPDVVLTRDSKRKLPSVVAWKSEDRAYGTDALNLAARYPGDTFPDLKLLLGRSANGSADQEVRRRYSSILNATLIPTERNTLAAVRATDYTLDGSGPAVHTVEELVAMQLSHAKTLAEETAKEQLKVTFPGSIGTFGGLDAVVTVPTFWTAVERQALYDAAALAGFRPRIVSDAAAAAVSFSLNRNFPSPELHLFYDSGHSSTRASLVRFSTQSFPTQDLFGTSLKEHTFIEVVSTAWSREAGGLSLDEALREILVQKYVEAQPKGEDIRANPRAMAKLLLSASKAKQVLSANSDARVNIEGLVGDIDFRALVTREEFEGALSAKGLDKAFGAVVKDALSRGEAKLSDVQSVVLLGGNTRVPLVQRSLTAAGVDSTLLAQNLNADEAMALGAGFYGASFNPQLKMKPLRIADVSPYEVVLREVDGKEEVLWKRSPATLAQESHSRVYDGQTDDFSFDIGYAPQEETLLQGFDRPLYRVEVEEIDNTLKSLKQSGELAKVDTSVNLTISSRPLGIYVVEDAWLTVTPKKGGVVGALRSFFGSTNGNSAAKTDDTNATSADAHNATSASGSDTNTTAESADAIHPKHVRLSVKTSPLGSVSPMSGQAQSASKDKLYLLDSKARRKVQKEEYRNKLEAYVYRMRELASGSDSVFEQSSKAEERAKIQTSSQETGDWLGSTECERASADDLQSRLSKLESLVKPIEGRMAEARGRNGATKRLERAFTLTTAFLEEASANLTAAIAEGKASRFSRTDLDSLQTQLKTDKAWFEKVSKLQGTKKQDDEPAWKVVDADKRAKKLTEKVTKLKKRRIPKTRPASTTKVPAGSESEASKSSNATSSSSSASSHPRHEEL